MINERYKWVASAIGIQAAARTIVTTNTVVGNRSVIFPGIAKIYAVFDPAPTPAVRLSEVNFDLLRNRSSKPDPPIEYAIQNMGAASVTIFLGNTPGTVYPLQADAQPILGTLVGASVPSFSEDFHDVLVYGAMSTELEKMEKYDMAALQEARFKQRLDDLRLFMDQKS